MVNRMCEFLEGKNAVIIEMAADAHPEVVTVITGIGRKRIIDMLVVEQLPRIYKENRLFLQSLPVA